MGERCRKMVDEVVKQARHDKVCLVMRALEAVDGRKCGTEVREDGTVIFWKAGTRFYYVFIDEGLCVLENRDDPLNDGDRQLLKGFLLEDCSCPAEGHGEFHDGTYETLVIG
jgi:hypothetical protein